MRVLKLFKFIVYYVEIQGLVRVMYLAQKLCSFPHMLGLRCKSSLPLSSVVDLWDADVRDFDAVAI